MANKPNRKNASVQKTKRLTVSALLCALGAVLLCCGRLFDGSLDLTMLGAGLWKTVGLLGLLTVCIFTLHDLLSRLFRIDADRTVVTMTAGVYGPAFIPAVTGQLKNDKLTAPGLICGALGYAIGTFLGSGLYFLL